MKLLRVVTQSVRGLADGAYSFAERTTGLPLELAVVGGAAATGKTALLDAVALSWRAIDTRGVLPASDRLLRRGHASGRVEVTWQLSEDEVRRTEAATDVQTMAWRFHSAAPAVVECDDGLERLVRFRGNDEAGSAVLHLPSTRRLMGGSRRLGWMSAREAPWCAAETPANVYECIPWRLATRVMAQGGQLLESLAERGVLLHADVTDALAAVKQAVSRLAPELRLLTAEAADDRALVWFTHRDQSRILLEELADSERQALLLASVLALAPLRDSVILLDAPELDIASSFQWAFLQAVATTCAGNQLIAATGSETIISAAAPMGLVCVSLSSAPTRAEGETSA